MSAQANVASRESSGGFHFSVVLGVTGGIAAYKSPAIVRALRDAGGDVHVVPTAAALQMVGRTTWEAISSHPVYVNVPEGVDKVSHVRLGKQADLLLIAPATANTIAKLAAGIADNMLTATALVATCPVVLAPAMHTQMWQHPATQANVATLRARGVQFIGPESGRLTGADSGPGRMSEPADIAAYALQILREQRTQRAAASPEATAAPEAAASPATPASPTADLLLPGKKVLISAGGTHEPIDPVRYIGNRSTGHMGVALANAARAQGAEVRLVAANITGDVLSQLDEQVTVTPVGTALELQQAMRAQADAADVIIMSAAVADYRPAAASVTKQKRNGEPYSLQLVENPDILADLAANRAHPQQLVVGFAAETGDSEHSALEYGIAKAASKGADLLVINEVGEQRGFGAGLTGVTIVTPAGKIVGTANGSKPEVATAILNAVAVAWPQNSDAAR